MYSLTEVNDMIAHLSEKLQAIFPQDRMEVILFGSYARNEADDESDIDVMYLVDSSRKTIAEKHWQVGEAAAETLLDYGIVISPIVENRDFYLENVGLLPLFKNIQREGVRLHA